MDEWKNYKYYKGESENPYESKDFGKAFWWVVESYAADAKDDKEPDMLSMTMVNYIKNLHWESPGYYDTTKEEMLKRADELYNSGYWSGSYISSKRYTFRQVVEESKRH